MSEPIRFENADGIARLTLNRPDEGNAIDQAFADRLLDLAHLCEDDATIRCVILTGSGRFFCVGGNVRAFASAEPELGIFVRKLTAALHMAGARLAALSKPLVVAVNGPAAGAGLGLALLGDVVLAGGSAKFTLAYPGIGLSPDAGTTFLLPRLIGLRRTQDMLFLGRSLGSDEAARMGLVTRAVADADLAAEAQSVAERLAAMPTAALARSKRLLLASSSTDLERQLEQEAVAIARSAVEPHAAEGIHAFLEGRRAVFR